MKHVEGDGHIYAVLTEGTRQSLIRTRKLTPQHISVGIEAGRRARPSSAAWSRGPGDYGRVAYVTTDGGTTAPPPDGKIRPAKVLRVEFSQEVCLGRAHQASPRERVLHPPIGRVDR